MNAEGFMTELGSEPGAAEDVVDGVEDGGIGAAGSGCLVHDSSQSRDWRTFWEALGAGAPVPATPLWSSSIKLVILFSPSTPPGLHNILLQAAHTRNVVVRRAGTDNAIWPNFTVQGHSFGWALRHAARHPLRFKGAYVKHRSNLLDPRYQTPLPFLA